MRAYPYNPRRFKNVRSLAVDNNNTLYVGRFPFYLILHFLINLINFLVERNIAPGRMGLFDATSGEWKRDFYGPTRYLLLFLYLLLLFIITSIFL